MKRNMARILVLIFLTAALPSFARTSAVEYEYTDEAESGIVRYVAQMPAAEYYHQSYWGKYAAYSKGECGTACISMALSAIGIGATPEELGDYWISRGYTAGVPFSTMFSDVPGATGGHTYDFISAWEAYEAGEASPVIIDLTAELNPYRTGNRHFLLLIGNDGDTFTAVDPADDTPTTLVIRKEDDGYRLTLKAANGDTLSATETEEQLCSAQYRADPSAVSGTNVSEAKVSEAKAPETKLLGKAETAAPTADKTTPTAVKPGGKTPDMLYPLAKNTVGVTTNVSYLDVRIVFKDTGEDSYTVYIESAPDKGKKAAFGGGETMALTCTVGDGFTVRSEKGTITFRPPICLEAKHLYRYTVKTASGIESDHATYGYTGK